MNSIPMWVWVAAAIGAIAGLASTGEVISAVIGGAIWFGIAYGIALLLGWNRA